AQFAQCQPHLERAGDRSAHRSFGVHPLAQFAAAGQRRAEDDIGVSGQVLRDRVDDDVGAEVERRLQQRSGEGVVDGYKDPRLLAAAISAGTSATSSIGFVGDSIHSSPEAVPDSLPPAAGRSAPEPGAEAADPFSAAASRAAVTAAVSAMSTVTSSNPCLSAICAAEASAPW